MSLRLGTIAAFTSAIFAACAPSHRSSALSENALAAAQAAIRGLQDTNTAALNRKDAAAWAATFTDDATVYPPNREPVVGRAAIERFGNELLAAGDMRFTPRDFQISVAGDVAYMTFPWTLKITPATGTATEDRGHTLDVLKRQPDGTWRFHAVMWISALPMTR